MQNKRGGGGGGGGAVVAVGGGDIDHWGLGDHVSLGKEDDRRKERGARPKGYEPGEEEGGPS
jgi:hypothetical protein